MKIAPGVRVNLTKTGVSARVGPRGAGVTTGTSGTTVSAGIPGSGLHVSEKIKNRPKDSKGKVQPQEPDTKLGFWGWFGVIAALVLVIWGLSALLS